MLTTWFGKAYTNLKCNRRNKSRSVTARPIPIQYQNWQSCLRTHALSRQMGRSIPLVTANSQSEWEAGPVFIKEVDGEQ